MMQIEPSPLVSIVVRSMGRPELRIALASIARQDYPAIEVIVVDATGGSHPPLPAIPWPDGHYVCRVGGDRPLLRPSACNAGLDAIKGEWFCFLDDDDTYEPHYISAMMDAVEAHPGALLLYGRSNELGPDGQVAYPFGDEFNRALIYYRPLMHWSAALISTQVRDLGCHFDETLDIFEDQDFLRQIAQHADFVFVPVVGFNYRPDTGTSGTGSIGNRDSARLIYFEGLLRAKWAGPCEYHTALAGKAVHNAIGAYARGDVGESRRLLHRTLLDYPNDPNALHALARIDFDAGQLAEAHAHSVQAIEFSPHVAEFRYTQALILEALGKVREAREAALHAGADPAFRQAVDALIKRLPGPESETLATRSVLAISRNQPCPCGSGKRYKQCCGAQTRRSATGNHAVQATADELMVQCASVHFLRGDVFISKDILDGIEPARLTAPRSALIAADIYRELGEMHREFEFLKHAVHLADHPKLARRLTECIDAWFVDKFWDSLRAQSLRLMDTINSGRSSSVRKNCGKKPAIHMICHFQNGSGSANRAIRLGQILAPHTSVTYWSLDEAVSSNLKVNPDMRTLGQPMGNVPMGGTAVIISDHFDARQKLAALSNCDRIILCANAPGLDNMKRIVAILSLMAEMRVGFSIDFTYPSDMWRQRLGLGGLTEYPLADSQRFLRRPPQGKATSGLIVGHLTHSPQWKFHPGYHDLIRRLVALGYVCRLMGPAPLADSLKQEIDRGQVQLLPIGAMDDRDFLESLDCFLYWKHPLWIETGGDVILEAMLMELPVILFAGDLGIAELIENGRDGFMVVTEEEALACLDKLAAAPELRISVGQAARRKVVETLDRQQARLLDFYLEEARPEPLKEQT